MHRTKKDLALKRSFDHLVGTSSVIGYMSLERFGGLSSAVQELLSW
jgi:hypothetical protein